MCYVSTECDVIGDIYFILSSEVALIIYKCVMLTTDCNALSDICLIVHFKLKPNTLVKFIFDSVIQLFILQYIALYIVLVQWKLICMNHIYIRRNS